MPRHIKYTDAERQLARQAREVAMNRDVLYHGTRYAQSVLETGVLFYSFGGDPKVSFTRSPETASHFAALERNDDEGRGAILIFDRQSLQCRYRVEPYHDGWGDVEGDRYDEAEERIWENVIDVDKHLIGIVYGPTIPRSHQHEMMSRERIDWILSSHPSLELYRRLKDKMKA